MTLVELSDRATIAAFFRRNARRSRLRARRPRRLRLAPHALVRVGARRRTRAGGAALQRALRPGADRDRRGAGRVDGDAAPRAPADAARRALRSCVAAAPRRLSRALRGRGRRAASQARARPHRPARAERGSRRSPRRGAISWSSTSSIGAAYPETWFTPRMLATGRYVGIRHDGRLACVAGVHVHSPAWGVAALGNVATLPELRGRGLARAACAALCLLLLEDGIETIALNVRADNAAAIAAYSLLGFEVATSYWEASLRDPRASGASDGRNGGRAGAPRRRPAPPPGGRALRGSRSR